MIFKVCKANNPLERETECVHGVTVCLKLSTDFFFSSNVSIVTFEMFTCQYDYFTICILHYFCHDNKQIFIQFGHIDNCILIYFTKNDSKKINQITITEIYNLL